ncbi:glycoside hydrolase family 79 protein [Plicaturopsis crispa FD-325 SS-3]|uniref:Glycoside hydrolase family 79 protein n=1 Tax=Plicaturopsis crispa FD-325 SS-3 TaxID=944288 RepID=A0A0C9T841_PLICR|nr:glycoside hydrolase family 79 protein [Plicaturopsis crispa FD-325 SS-3]
MHGLPLPAVLLCGSLLLSTLPSPAFGQKAPVNVSFSVTPTQSQLQNVILDNFLGISWELSSFDTLWGKTTDSMPNAMQNYLANLRARMSHPLRIRVGGNGMDASTYVPAAKYMIELTDPDAYFNDIPVNFGPIFFDVLNAMYDRVGSMQFIIGLSMLDPAEDGNVIELAAAAREKLGDRLDAMLLGNEPDLYAGHGTREGYTIQDYIPEIGKVIDDLRDAPEGDLINTTLIGGPSVCCDWDLDDIIDAGLDEYPYKYYSIQHYPQNTCSGLTAQNTNVSYYIQHSNVGSYVNWNYAGITMAKQAGVPVLLTEYNSVSCGGSNISDTFATAMWAIDAGLKSAASNFSAIYLHTREWNISYNLFDPPTADTSTSSGWRTGSPYYSALFLSEAFSKNGSVVADLNIDNSEYQASTMAGYGIYDSNGTAYTRSKLVLFNFDDGTPQTFMIPSNVTFAVATRMLTAPNVLESTNISWAGQTVGAIGQLEGVQTTPVTRCRNGCNVTVPGPGVALVLFNPLHGLDSFYEGNSTIADYPSGGARAISRSTLGSVIACISLGVAFQWLLFNS